MTHSRHLMFLITFLYIPAIVAMVVLWKEIDVMKAVAISLAISAPALAWDVWLTFRGAEDLGWIWAYNPKTTSGLRWLHSPLEQYLFGPGVVLCALLFWELIKLSQGNWNLYLATLVGALTWNTGFATYFYFQSSRL